MTFKATAKGNGKLGSSILGDVWLHALFFFILAVTIGIAVWQLVAGAALVSPLLISARRALSFSNCWFGLCVILSKKKHTNHAE